MWVFTKSGFYSVVAHRNAADCLLVRSRWRWPLENLLKTCPPAGLAILAGQGIIEIPGDYRFRVAVRRADFGAWLAGEASAVDYDNFKSAAHKVAEWTGAPIGALHKIWDVLAVAAEQRDRPAKMGHADPRKLPPIGMEGFVNPAGRRTAPKSAPALAGPRRQIGLPL